MCSISVSSLAFRANARLRFRPMQLLLFLLPFRVDKLIFSIKLFSIFFCVITISFPFRCSFDESHRQPIFLLGGIPALAELIQVRPQAKIGKLQHFRAHQQLSIRASTFSGLFQNIETKVVVICCFQMFPNS